MINNKLPHIDISGQLWKEMTRKVRDGIFHKLKVARNVVAIDKDIAGRSLRLCRRRIWETIVVEKSSCIGWHVKSNV